jgi:RNA polymerase sigma-70 factor, ECF subfamily
VNASYTAGLDRSGDSTAFEVIFTTHYESIARAIARVVHDNGRAEELAVETFWKLSGRTEMHGADDAQVRGWLHRTALRLALDELRRRARRTRYESLLGLLRMSRRPSTPDELFSSQQEQGRVRFVLAKLPVRDAELLLLRHDGASYDEMARSLELNSASIGTLLSRAQTAFRKEYVKHYGER